MKHYTASKSKTQEREFWSIILRHPLRKDSKGRDGLRIRRGLGTSDSNEADKLVSQMNELLENESLWNLSAKPLAERRYHPIIIKAFYDSIETPPRDYWAIRENLLPLPSAKDDYARIIFVGTTGAGKTTLLRQLIGSDPKRDRFPLTSAGKATVSDIEVIMAEGPYQAIVTFFSEEQTRLLIEESVAEAVINADEGGNDESIARRLLTHKEQRFRLNYLLGDYKTDDEDIQDGNDSILEDFQEQEIQNQEIPAEELDKLKESLQCYIKKTIEIANQTRKTLDKQLNTDSKSLTGKDREIAQELFEDLILDQEEFGLLVDELMDDIEKRFGLVQEGEIKPEKGNWPQYWEIKIENRDEFIKTIRRFSGNDANLFGRLLTPLVQGIRIKGPLYPKNWSIEHPKLVLMDGQGLGHTPDSAQSLPTSLTQRFGEVDVILLVDNATQPIQAGSIAVLRSVGASGHHSKLAIAFTHFDNITADNLQDTKAKKNHILNSLTNGMTALKEILGLPVIRSIERELVQRCFFLGHLQKELAADKKLTRSELNRLIATLQSSIVVKHEVLAKPSYDTEFLLFALQGATKDFRMPWSARLGLTYSGANPEHWTRIKAISRRISLKWSDEYDTLRPVADLIARLTERISLYLNNPVRWEPETVSEEEKQQRINVIRQEVNMALHPLINDYLIGNQFSEWVKAYGYRGQGSTRLRAQDIESIFEKAAPLLSEVPSPSSLDFLSDIIDTVNAAILSGGGSVESSSRIRNLASFRTNEIGSPTTTIEERMHTDVLEHKH